MSASFPSLLFLIRFSLVHLVFVILPSLTILSFVFPPPFSSIPPLSTAFNLAASPLPALVSVAPSTSSPHSSVFYAVMR
jgi:hypothetical protein